MTASRALVTACTANFTTGALGLLKSAAKFHPDVTRYCFAPIEQVEEVSHHLARWAEVVPIPRKLRNSPTSLVCQTSWSRVFVGTIPADNVVWMDSDTIFCNEAPALWECGTGQVNVVLEQAYNIGNMVPSSLWEWYHKRFGLSANTEGFNAGVFGLRTQDWRTLPEIFEESLVGCDSGKLPFGMDQAILNGIWFSNTNRLDRVYNCHCLYELGVQNGVKVLHFTSSPKPWMSSFKKHHPGYYQWLKYGEMESRYSRLGLTYLQGIFGHPRRMIYKACRKILTQLGLWKAEMGIGK